MRWLCLAIALGTGACKEQAPIAEASQAPRKGLCEHGVPADICTRCNPDLVATYKALGDWCEEHQVAMSQCKVHNPNLTFTTPPADWCSEHGLPESKCTKCNPKLVAQFIEQGDFCREHGFPKSVCPRCNPELAKSLGMPPAEFPEPGTRVRLASAGTAREAGIETVVVQKEPFARSLDVVGKLTFDQNRLAQIASRAEGTVLEMRVDVGDEVKAGAPIAVLASGAVGADQGRLAGAKARLDTARAAHRRAQQLVNEGIGAQRGLEDATRELASAQAEYDSAAASLKVAGASSEGSSGRVVLTAPFAGTVVARSSVAGRTVSAGEVLAEVADLRTLWAMLDVPEQEALNVRRGQRVALTFDGIKGESREGVVDGVSPVISPETRTVSVRITLPNPDGALKAGLFVRAKVELAAPREALLVPREAVQRAEGQPLVFVRGQDGTYDPVRVELGAGDAERVEVTKGLVEGAAVVTTGAFLLKTEILKDSIGAGCCEVEKK